MSTRPDHYAHVPSPDKPLLIWRRLLIAILALALVRGLVYAFVTPPWQAPDEPGHFEYSWLMVRLGRLPSLEDISPEFELEMLASLYTWRYGEFTGRPLPERMPTRLEDLSPTIHAQRSRTVLIERFSLAYLWQALFLLPVRAQDLVFQLFAVRFSSVLLNLGIVWLAFRTFRELMPARPKIALGMALFVVLMPQHTFINSTVGDGTLAELMSCLVLYGWVRLFRYGARLESAAGIVVGTAAGVLSKATAIFLVPLDVLLTLWYLRQQRHALRKQSRAVYYYLAGLLVAGGIGAWVWSGSAVGVSALGFLKNLTSSSLLWVDLRGITLGQALLASYDSFWANFGWMAVPVSPRWYGGILLLTLLAALGWLIGNRERRDHLPGAAVLMGVTLLAALVPLIWTNLLIPRSGYYQYQGRYLFSATIPFVYLLVGGWLQLVPPQRQRSMLLAGIVFLAVFDLWCLLGTVIPYFYYR